MQRFLTAVVLLAITSTSAQAAPSLDELLNKARKKGCDAAVTLYKEMADKHGATSPEARAASKLVQELCPRPPKD